MDDVTFGSAILIGAWVFFVTAQPFRKKNDARYQEALPENSQSEATADGNETWSFDLKSADRSAIEEADQWVLG